MYLVRSPLHSRATIDDDRWIAICGISHLHCTLFGRFPRVDRRTARPNEDSLHYHSSTEQHDLSFLSLATIIWDGTGIVCDLRRTPNTMPQNKKYDVAAGSKKRPLPRLLLPTRASSQVMRLNVEDKKRLQMKGRGEERRREARLEDRESERASEPS